MKRIKNKSKISIYMFFNITIPILSYTDTKKPYNIPYCKVVYIEVEPNVLMHR